MTSTPGLVPAEASAPGRQPEPTQAHRRPAMGRWLGLLPYLAFVAVFLVVPIVANLVRTFAPSGTFTLDTIAQIVEPPYLSAFTETLWLSLVTAVVGGLMGFVLAWALTHSRGPQWLRTITTSYAALASQSGGVPLAYAFIATLGTQGLITVALADLGVDTSGWRLDSFWGVAVVYLYFQAPLMTILMLPAMGALRNEWREAAASLGATRAQYMRDVAVPVLWPATAGALMLLFANAFAAYATAYALAGGGLNLVPILVGFFISGNVLLDPGLAAALVTGMMVVIIAAMALRHLLERRSRSWLDIR